LDVARGLGLTGGSEKQYREVLALYCQDAARRLETLRAEPDEANLALLASQFHALKSASASIGAAALAGEAERLEAAGKKGDLAFVKDWLNGFCECLSLLVSHIGDALSTPTRRRKAERRKSFDRRAANERRKGMDRRKIAESAAADRDLLHRLKEALAQENIGAVDEITEKLLAKHADSESGQALRSISDFTITADFGEAAKIVDSLLSAAYSART
jgi:HPt (histidine-containing phosphotransfer) domain-containing protein